MDRWNERVTDEYLRSLEDMLEGLENKPNVYDSPSKKVQRVAHALREEWSKPGSNGTPEMYALLLWLFNDKRLVDSVTTPLWVGYPGPRPRKIFGTDFAAAGDRAAAMKLLPGIMHPRDLGSLMSKDGAFSVAELIQCGFRREDIVATGRGDEIVGALRSVLKK
jgi:hypothetical protein